MALIAAQMQPACVAETSVGQEVTVSGRLDVNSVVEVRLALHDILDRGVGDLLIHLAQAEIHDASGLGVIVGAHHRARQVDRRLVLVDVSARLDRLLRGSRLHRVLAREPTQTVVRAAAVTAPEAAIAGIPAVAAGIPAVLAMRSAVTAVSATETVVPFSGTVAPLAE